MQAVQSDIKEHSELLEKTTDIAQKNTDIVIESLKKEASAVAPGQSAVFYVGRRVVGGAFIASQRGIGMYIPS